MQKAGDTMAQLTDSIRLLPGIGPKKAALFANLGIETLGDLLQHYPRDYEDRTRIVPIKDLEPGTPACFLASVISNPQTHAIPKPGGKRLEVTKVTVADHTARLHLTYFNAGYTVSKLVRGEQYCFYGSLEGDFLGYGMTNPLFEPLDSEGNLTRRIMPIYPLTAGLSNKMISQAVQQALERCSLPELLPEEVRQRQYLCSREVALRQIHAPDSHEALEQAKKRLIFEEFYIFSTGLALLRSQRALRRTKSMDCRGMERFYDALPFRLTGAQMRCIREILADMEAGQPMSRLVQGDVGSGKTMVAAAAAFCAAKNGGQAALMAPTEILARQHYEGLFSLFAPLGIRLCLLVGSMTPKQKKECREKIAAGEADLVIGTHALLTETTVFRDLRLVIADEQHRFGVAQRAALMDKGQQPHLLIMSATPIPRTLSLILYGDLDVSIIDELPPGRQPVESFLVDERYRTRLNGFIRKQAQEGHQSYIVCPAIEDSETESLKAAETWIRTLQESAFPDLRLALLHGKMKGSEKEAVMTAFAAGEYDILVSTTVIEVGVDVPNATLMVVENAERFGLSQLHQLRGRVGRGKAKSWCILVSDIKDSQARQRMKELCATNDGFKVAQADLKLRGPGDFFGSRQHGLPLFRVADLVQDLSILKEAQEEAARAVASKNLPEALLTAIETLLKDGYSPN